ncbi:hypothetical protein [Kozakia baliensis]|uniref:hypothetical protein n=1 Tax=Kozakia baliensis TaxID=153496 RepID=UPI00049648C8|nr:hypothetical protein [Kozakia baliensis]AOX20214.1 hypothetical protein A0U90_07840 [Kozakia baliensis]
MNEKLDPKELKVLSDILALVLEDQAGQASTALDAIRARAKRNNVTGGALKNLFVAIAPEPPQKARTRTRTRSTASNNTAESIESRQRITTLTNDLRQLDLELRTSRARVDALRTELHQTQQSRAELQTLLHHQKGRRSTRMSVLWWAFGVGALIGIAGTQFAHSILDIPHPDNAVFLH